MDFIDLLLQYNRLKHKTQQVLVETVSESSVQPVEQLQELDIKH